MKITTIGIDLAKEVFQIHGVDEHGKAVLRKQLRRSKMAEFFANLEPCLIGLEAVWQNIGRILQMLFSSWRFEPYFRQCRAESRSL
jgi:transposase